MSYLKNKLEEEDFFVYQPILESIQELLGANYIQNQRIYDMLAIIADKLGADAKSLASLHENGDFLAPAPSFIFQNDQEIEQEKQL